MRTGIVVSAGLHAALILAGIVQLPWMSEPEPLVILPTEVTLVDAVELEAALSKAPEVSTDLDIDLAGAEADAAADSPDELNAETEASGAPVELGEIRAPEARPDLSVFDAPRLPTNVPTEAPRVTIGAVPLPEETPFQAPVPQSPQTDQFTSPLSSGPTAPLGPAPMLAPSPNIATRIDEPPPPEPDETDPNSVAEVSPPGPADLAPQEAAIPVARPAELAAAAPASQATREEDAAPSEREVERQAEAPQAAPQETPAAKPERQETPTPPRRSASRFLTGMDRMERDGLRLAIDRHFAKNVAPRDPNTTVTLRIRLNRAGRIVEGPVRIAAANGTEDERTRIERAGRRALILAQQANVFAELPSSKFAAWELIHVTFTYRDLGFDG